MRERSAGERRILAAGRKLRRFLDAIGVSVPVFCERHRLDRITVQRILNGERWRFLPVDTALDLMRAIEAEARAIHWRGGAIASIDDFRSRTATPATKAA